jgi:type IV pilus assembly protein PilN
MIKVNLLPVRAIRKKESIRQQISIGVLTLVLAFIIMGFFHISIERKITLTNNKITETEKEIKTYSKVLKEINSFKEKKKILIEKIKIIEKLEQNRKGPFKLFAELSRVIPERAWLESLAEKQTRIEVRGVAADNKTIAAFMNSIEGSETFHDVELEVSKVSHKFQEKGFKNFTLHFTLDPKI